MKGVKGKNRFPHDGESIHPGRAWPPSRELTKEDIMMKKLWNESQMRYWIIALPICLWIVASCQDDMLVSQQPMGDAIVFTTVADSLVSSRASSVASTPSERHFLGLIGKDSLYITLKEEENIAPAFPEFDARGHSRFMYGDFAEFYLNAYLEDGSEFMKNQKVTKLEDDWYYTPIKYWPQNQSVHFWGYASNISTDLIAPDCQISNDTYKGTFSYELPQAATDKKDAERQPDLVFSIVPNQRKQTINGKVHLPFYHALSAIQFKVGTLPEDVVFTNTTWDISLANVSTFGYCTYTGGPAISYTWTNTNTEGTYTQQYAFSSLQNGISNDQTFMMIPQALDEATLKIAFTYAGNEYTFEKALRTFGYQWDANKKYTYVISISEAVEVDITDTVNDNVKSNVVIRNTGLSDAYIRAAIVGYWENEAGNVVDWWDSADTNDGGFAYAANWNDYWIQQGDFYYYKYPIKVGATPTVPLFESYTLTRSDAPAGSTLKLNIVVQAVKYEAEQTSLTSAWDGNMPADFISNTFEQTNQGE